MERPKRADRNHLRRVVNHTRLIQIDSVNVLARAHYLPLAAVLNRELKLMARWLELERIEVVPIGDVAVKLSSGPV